MKDSHNNRITESLNVDEVSPTQYGAVNNLTWCSIEAARINRNKIKCKLVRAGKLCWLERIDG